MRAESTVKWTWKCSKQGEYILRCKKKKRSKRNTYTGDVVECCMRARGGDRGIDVLAKSRREDRIDHDLGV